MTQQEAIKLLREMSPGLYVSAVQDACWDVGTDQPLWTYTVYIGFDQEPAHCVSLVSFDDALINIVPNIRALAQPKPVEPPPQPNPAMLDIANRIEAALHPVSAAPAA